MKRMSRSSKIAFACIAGIGAMLAATAFVQPASAARPIPGPLCGPTILFLCTGDNGEEVLVGLTRCEVDKFEKKTGLTCEPYGG